MTYEVVERLARGGMGVVDLAVDEHGDQFALKRLALVGTTDEMERSRHRFEREVEVLRRLDDPAIVPLVDVLDEDGEIIVVMPFLAGGNLATLVSRHGPLPADRVHAMADRLLGALATAHRAGVVHRDIKPGNVLFDADGPDGEAFLADFGVAVTRDGTPGLTQTGIVLGTPGFLSPEQARGEDVSFPSDVASLGATLAFAATGESPYGSGDSHAVLLRTARGKPELPRDLDPSLRARIQPMLDPRPERRPTAAAARGGAAGTSVLPLVGDRARWRVAAGVVAGALVLGAGIMVANGDDDPAVGPSTTTTASTTTTTTEPPCIPLRYRPCGEPAAPFTDGERCIDDHEDYDEVTDNGCEAAPDAVDGSLLGRVTATIVPRDDIDEYLMDIGDGFQLTCDGRFQVTLAAPAGMTLNLRVLDPDGEVVGEAVSADGVSASVSVREPRCTRDDAGIYRAVVSPVGSDRVGDAYVIERTGSF